MIKTSTFRLLLKNKILPIPYQPFLCFSPETKQKKYRNEIVAVEDVLYWRIQFIKQNDMGGRGFSPLVRYLGEGDVAQVQFNLTF